VRKLLASFFIISSLVLSFASDFHLTILHTSDIHGSVFPVDYVTGNSSDVGLAKISSFVTQMRCSNPNTLVIDTGDLIQGTPFSYFFAKIDNSGINPVIKAMNLIDLTSSTIGNCEFSYGPRNLENAMVSAEFPFLSANIVFDDSAEHVFQPYSIITLEEEGENVRIAILGLTTNLIPRWEDPEHIAGLAFLNPVNVAEELVSELRDEVDVLIVAYHGGFERDLTTGEPTEELTDENVGFELVKTIEGIDVLLTGHQHRTIAEIIDGVVVSQPSSLGRFVGKVDLKLERIEDGWQIVEKSVEQVSMASYDPDDYVVGALKDFETRVQKWLERPVGFSIGDFFIEDPLEAKMKDNPLAQFINRVQMEATGATISCAAICTDEITGWKTGPITIRDLISIYPMSSTLKVIQVSGSDIKAALERSAEYFTCTDNKISISESWLTPKLTSRDYDMWEGIEYIIAVDRPVGERVLSIRYQGKPVDMDEKYEVVMSSYRAGGGGGYSMFERRPVVRDVMLEVSEVIIDHVLGRFVVSASVDNNWSVGTGFIHTIGWNETLRSISEMYRIDTSEIMKYNPDLIRVDRIPAGSELIIYRPAVQKE